MTLTPEEKLAIHEYLASERDRLETRIREELKREVELSERWRRTSFGVTAVTLVALVVFVWQYARSQVDLQVQEQVRAALSVHEAMIAQRVQRADATLDEMAANIGRMDRRNDELVERMTQLDADISSATQNAKLLASHDVARAVRLLATLETHPEARMILERLVELRQYQEDTDRKLTGQDAIPALRLNRLVVGGESTAQIEFAVDDTSCKIVMTSSQSSFPVTIGNGVGHAYIGMGGTASSPGLIIGASSRMAGLLCIADKQVCAIGSSLGPEASAPNTAPVNFGELGVESFLCVSPDGVQSYWKDAGAMRLSRGPANNEAGFQLFDVQGMPLFSFQATPKYSLAEFSRPGTGRFTWSSNESHPSLIRLNDQALMPRVSLGAAPTGGYVVVGQNEKSWLSMSWLDGGPGLESRGLGSERSASYRLNFPN